MKSSPSVIQSDLIHVLQFYENIIGKKERNPQWIQTDIKLILERDIKHKP